MSDSIDVLFLVPPMRPILRPLDLVHIFFRHSQNTNNIISVQLGLLSMASHLRIEGISCQYHDLAHFKGEATLYDTISGLIRKCNPKIVALTSYTSNFNAALKTIQIIKSIDPNVLVCVGGSHVTFLDRYSIDESDNKIDIVVRGEGERTMLDIAKNFLKNDSIELIEDSVRGITTKNKRNPDQKLLTSNELRQLPPIAFDLIPQSERNNYIYIPLTATRGCAYQCTFCTNPLFWDQKVRFRPPENVIEEVLIAEALFPKRLFEFSDTILPINMGYFEKLVDLYINSATTPIKMALTRANLTDDKRLRIMKRLIQDDGYVSIGVENGNPSILKIMGKPTWEEQLDALKKLKKYRLNSIPTWMVGFCGENISTKIQNLEKLEFLNKKELIQSVILNIWIPIPGSPPFQNPKKFGLKIHTYNWDYYDRAVYPPPYSLFNPINGKTTLTSAEIWAYYLSMISLQNRWSTEKKKVKGKGVSINQLMNNIAKNSKTLYFSPAGESHNTIYEDEFDQYQNLFNPFRNG